MALWTKSKREIEKYKLIHVHIHCIPAATTLTQVQKKKNSFTHKWHPAAHQETDSDFNADHVQGDTNYENTGNTKDLLKYSQTLK